MKLFLPIILLLTGCFEHRETYVGKIIQIKTSGSMKVVTLDTLVNKPRGFGAIGHGELWLLDADEQLATTPLNKEVIISGTCDGWVCRDIIIRVSGVE